MLTRLLQTILLPVFACTVEFAHADVYTWVDASGTVNYSNLAPPEGVRVTNVMHESGPKVATLADTTRDVARGAEVQALSERVQQLERELELNRRQMAPPMEYSPLPMPPAVPYTADLAPPASTGCDPASMDCEPGFGPSIYPAGVIVLRPPNFHRIHPFRSGHRFVVQRPVRASGSLHRR
jgi:hypothetical protein